MCITQQSKNAIGNSVQEQRKKQLKKSGNKLLTIRCGNQCTTTISSFLFFWFEIASGLLTDNKAQKHLHRRQEKQYERTLQHIHSWFPVVEHRAPPDPIVLTSSSISSLTMHGVGNSVLTRGPRRGEDQKLWSSSVPRPVGWGRTTTISKVLQSY